MSVLKALNYLKRERRSSTIPPIYFLLLSISAYSESLPNTDFSAGVAFFC